VLLVLYSAVPNDTVRVNAFAWNRSSELSLRITREAVYTSDIYVNNLIWLPAREEFI
jgi:hypothetical protein